jgi:hypothetical protein
MWCVTRSARCWWSGTEGELRSCAPDAAHHSRRCEASSGVMRCRAGAHDAAICVACWRCTATRCSASGTRYLALPDGQNTQAAGQRPPPNIFFFTEIRNRRIRRRNPAQGRGAFRDRHERGLDGGGRGSHRRDWICRAGNRERSRRAHDQCDPRTAKSCGPGARGLCVKSCGDVYCPTGHAHQSSARRRGNSASLPGESTT